MKNYQGSDYAINKNSDGIVYRFADGTTFTVTLEGFLAENPNLTADDFRKLKEFSDKDYLEQDRSDYRQTWKNVSFDELAETVINPTPSPEAVVIDQPAEAERQEKRRELAKRALDQLTDVQRRRYLMYHVEGLSTYEIAEIEGKDHKAIFFSLQAAEKKIKKIISED